MNSAGSKSSHSLVLRLLIAQVIPLAILAIVVLVVGAWTAQRIVADNSDRLLAGALQTIRATASVEHGRITVDVAPWTLALLDGPERDAVFYSVRDGDQLVTGYKDLPNLAQAQQEEPVFADLSVRGVPVRMVQQTLDIPGHAAPIRVSVAQSLDSRSASLRELYRSLLLPPALLVVLAAILIWPALQWGLISLKSLIQDLARRPGISAAFAPADIDLAPREFWPVLTAFNHLLTRVETSTAGVHRFAADASHQLRTPLSIVSANIALLADSHRSWTPQQQRLIDDSRDAANRMTRLVEQLLSTARAEAARIGSSADLGRAARRACQAVRARRDFPDGALRLRLAAEPVIVLGAEDFITEQILNLIDNAFHHGAAPVFVHVRAAGSVSVWDHGEGVSETALPHLADRFFRASTTDTPGSGLGLAIVASLAKAQGCDFELRNRNGTRSGLVGRLVFQARNEGIVA
ncbi:sensor histidine kinase [Brevundimonas vesicularis]|uniref:histidine kinase n=1 Tax=Brevundimonas vesicularis TaxID=41276 RepID=A0A1Z3UAH2_BREVE|nr:sensor histidine kinase [Brevundimonas vesicularis]ASE40267.1 sensor histidine kinase [Brevundimonas vesicularis]